MPLLVLWLLLPPASALPQTAADPGAVVSRALQALVAGSLNDHLAHFAAEVTVESTIDGTPQLFAGSRDSYRRELELLSARPEGIGIVAFEVIAVGDASKDGVRWVHARLWSLG